MDGALGFDLSLGGIGRVNNHELGAVGFEPVDEGGAEERDPVGVGFC